MNTALYKDETAYFYVKWLLNPIVAAAIAEVAVKGDKATKKAKEIAGIAFAKISFGKNGTIPFGILMDKNSTHIDKNGLNASSTFAAVQIVSDPYYRHNACVTKGPVGTIYRNNLLPKTVLSLEKERPILKKCDKFIKRDTNREYNLGALLTPISLDPRKVPPDDINVFAQFLRGLPTGTIFIYGHDDQGGRFHIKHLETSPQHLAKKN